MLALGRPIEMNDLVARTLRVLTQRPLTGYGPAWRQLTAATTTPTRCSTALTRLPSGSFAHAFGAAGHLRAVSPSLGPSSAEREKYELRALP